MTAPRSKCGTNAGYVAHGLRGEAACDDCKRGKRDYARALKMRRLREKYGAPEPRVQTVTEPSPYPEGWLLPEGAKVKRFDDGEPVVEHAPDRVLIVDDQGREHAVLPDDDDKAPRATEDDLDRAWRQRVRREAYTRG